MDLGLIRSIDAMEVALVPSEKANAGAAMKPRKKSMTSMYLKFFEIAPDGKSRRCKFCGQSYAMTTATGNLGKHLSHRHPGYDRQADNSQLVSQSAVSTKKPQPQLKLAALDFDNLNWLLLKWIFGASLPLSIFEDQLLLTSLRVLNSSVKLWPAEKSAEIAHEVFKSMQEDVKASLLKVNSKVSITLDFWVSYEQVTYMCVKCHWIDDTWSLHKVLLDVIRIPYPCTGSETFLALMKVLKMFNIEKKILSCTTDYVQHAVHACHALKEEQDAKNFPFCYIPCASHALNQIIEDGLSTAKPIVSKIREFVLELNSNSEIALDFIQVSAAYQEGSWKFPLDASTSWSDNYKMLDIARKASSSMDTVIKKHEETFGSRNMMLSMAEKSAANMLHSYLEPFYKVTTNLCSSNLPTIGLVLFFMDHVSELIISCTSTCRQEWLKSVADDMAKRARSFNNQVHNLFTFIAAVLDPRIKKELIPENLNSEKNLEEARSHFVRYYSASHFPSPNNSFSAQDADSVNVVSFAEEIARKRRRGSISVPSDELSIYLSEPPAPIATDVLDWWKVNSARYPRLSAMARDYLAVQGTAVEPVELFTSKGEAIHKQRFCLPHTSVQCILGINSWMQCGYKIKFRGAELDPEMLIKTCSAAADNADLLRIKAS